MRRRQFLKQFAASTGTISCSQFLTYFMTFGLPANEKAFAMAADKSNEVEDPHFLVYWFIEGGWMGYDMFNPVWTVNNVVNRGTDISEERYRVLEFGKEDYGIYEKKGIRYGYLAKEGEELFPDMAILSSMYTGSGHSKERLRCHMGTYNMRATEERGEDERSVMQAFAEVYGQPYLLPHITWHWWLSDGELNELQYTGRKGYYHALGPSHAHTIYAGTPDDLRDFLHRMYLMSSDQVNMRIQSFLDNVEGNILDDNQTEVIRSYHSAKSIYRNLVERGKTLDPSKLSRLFNDKQLKEEFNIKPDDELITYRSVNGNKARTKFSPSVNVQAMMAYELISQGYTCAAFMESRDIRKFDSHYTRKRLWKPDGTPVGQLDTTDKMNEDLWSPLKTFVKKLKNTEYKNTGKSLYDLSTLVLTSEFGRTIHGDVDSIEMRNIPEAEKKKRIAGQDISQHWPVTSCAFMGGKVKGYTQFGGAGNETLMPIPIMPDGSFDPAYDPATGHLKKDRKKHEKSFTPDHGDVYATALYLSGINPEGKGRNTRPPLKFIKRT